MSRLLPLSTLTALVLLLVLAAPSSAHQPFFEEEDIVFSGPWRISDPTVSTVVYATLDSGNDVDYFAFDGQAGDRILLEITIPQIEGQDAFAPTMALMGPGLDTAPLPPRVERPKGEAGVLEIAPEPGPAETFYEPFSRTSYWERQSVRVTLPESGSYAVAVWHPDGQVGRYGFVIGDKEQLGGDLIGMVTKFPAYWTPVETEADESAATDAPRRTFKEPPRGLSCGEP